MVRNDFRGRTLRLGTNPAPRSRSWKPSRGTAIGRRPRLDEGMDLGRTQKEPKGSLSQKLIEKTRPPPLPSRASRGDDCDLSRPGLCCCPFRTSLSGPPIFFPITIERHFRPLLPLVMCGFQRWALGPLGTRFSHGYSVADEA